MSYLKQEGYTCAAADYLSALLKTASHTYACVVVDLTLPGGNGLNMVRRLKIITPRPALSSSQPRMLWMLKSGGLEVGLMIT